MTTDRALYLERETSDHRGAPPTNDDGREFLQFVERISRGMEVRTIRAWHYTRMSDAEVDVARRDGVYPSTLATLRRRLDAQVAAQVFHSGDRRGDLCV